MNMVNKVWKWEGYVQTALVTIPYSAVLQQLTRHRSFAFSVESSRASDLSLGFVPLWTTRGDGRMFDQRQPTTFQKAMFNISWHLGKQAARAVSMALRLAGAHRQHWQLPLKPYALVDAVISGSPYAWEHFFHLRLHKTSQREIRALAEELKCCFQTEPLLVRYGHFHGPYLEQPVRSLGVADAIRKDKPTEEALKVAQAITRVGRVSTGKLAHSVDDESAWRFVQRAYKLEHASVFEHHWVPRSPWYRSGPFRGCATLREALGL